MAMDNETEMTADDHTAAALHSMLDACLAEDSAGHEKAKKMAKAMKAMMGKEEMKEEAEPAKVEKEAEATEAKTVSESPAEAERQEQLFGHARMEQTVPFTKPRIDREKGIIYDVHIAGLESRTDGARYRISAHEKAAPRFEQMGVGIDHNYQGGPIKVGEGWGVLSGIYMKADGPYAKELQFLRTHERTEQILEDAERGLGMYSLSMVAKTKSNSKDIDEYIPSRVDLVYRGATTRTLFNQDQGTPAIPAVTKEQFDALALRFEQQQDEIADLKKRLTIREKVITPAVRLEQEIIRVEKAAAQDFDLKAFWDKSLVSK